MGSSRLPGKVLMDLAGRPVLWHVLHRLGRCRTLDQVVVATSTAPADDPLVAWCGELGTRVFRGSEDNVLQRYALAVAATDPEVIVRVTGDAALVDPGVVDDLVDLLVVTGADYATLDPAVRTLHEGMDPFTRGAFNRILAQGHDSPVAREHVSAYIKEHPDRFRIAYLPPRMDHRVPGGRFSVDTPADLAFLEAVYARTGATPGEADAGSVAALLREEPSLLAINGHVHQKQAQEKTRTAILRCDGDARLGMGHVVRCAALGDALRERLGWGVRFAVSSGPEAVQHLTRAGFPIHLKDPEDDEVAWLSALVTGLAPHAVVLDVRTALPTETVAAWRRQGVTVAVVDDLSDRRLAADLAFFPPVPQVRRVSWDGFTGTLHAGWEWVVLRDQFARRPAREAPREGPPTVLVTMGGTDPARLTVRAAAALGRVGLPFRALFVVGSGHPARPDLEAVLDRAPYPHRVLSGVEDMASVMAGADLALASFGVTAYELAAVGVPAAYLCLTADHAESAAALVTAGMGLSLGLAQDVTDEAVAAAVTTLLGDPARRRDMRARGLALVDGGGALRVARALAARVEAA
jgi:spore coat polysaccharide biosynthesis protein SpsF